MTILKIICMYCKREMGERDGQGVEGDTSSICRQCWEKHFPDEPYPENKK